MGYFPFDKSVFLKNKTKAKLLPVFQVNSTESDYAETAKAVQKLMCISFPGTSQGKVIVQIKDNTKYKSGSFYL